MCLRLKNLGSRRCRLSNYSKEITQGKGNQWRHLVVKKDTELNVLQQLQLELVFRIMYKDATTRKDEIITLNQR